MKKILLIFFLFFSFLFADSAKQFTLACDKYEDITDTKTIEESMKNGSIPENCLLLTSNAQIAIIDDNLENPKIVKILVIDIDSYMYSLKEDIIVTNENKI